MRSLLTAVIVVSTMLSLFQAVPPRDVRKEPSGAAVIGGVVRSDDGKPLRRASVRLSGGGLLTQRLVFTDPSGRFAFTDLPAGEYTITAQRASYMQMSVGSRRPGGSGSPVVLGDGQRLMDVSLRLPKYAAIGGTIYDPDGEPAVGVWVEALRSTMRTGRRTLSSVYGSPGVTDDRGVYRLAGLEPGEYFVAAGPSIPGRWQGSEGGTPGDFVRLTKEDVDRALLSRPATATGSPSAAPAAPPRPVSFATVLYPGSADVAGASLIAVKLGEEKTGMDIHLQFVATARLSGIVTGPDGQPVSNVQVAATAVTEAYSMALFTPDRLGTGRADAQGRFLFRGVPPGRYVVTTTRPPLWAMADVAVNGADQDVTLALQPGMTVSGRVAFDGATLPKPASAAGARIGLTAADTGSGVALGVASISAAADGTFAFNGVAPGTYRFSSSAPPSAPGWALRSVIVGGVDALDVPFDVKPGQPVDGAVILFTDRPTELSGSLLAPTGMPTSDCFIIVYAADKAFWTPASRRNVMVRPTTAGRFVVKNLPPGAYRIAAVTDVEQGAWWDPAFLESLGTASIPITLAEGEKTAQNLRIAGGH